MLNYYHGFSEVICQKCHDKIQEETPVYKKAYKKGQEDLYKHYFKNFKNPVIVEQEDVEVLQDAKEFHKVIKKVDQLL